MAHATDVVSTLQRELHEIFRDRLQSLAVYGLQSRSRNGAHHQHAVAALIHTLAIVDTLSAADLSRCAAHIERWHDAGLATPLVLAAHEFERSLDAFPLEFGAILSDHSVVWGKNPFDRLTINPTDVRRACEVQARSHLLHLREGALETAGNADRLAVLIAESAAPFAALLASVARLHGETASEPTAAGRFAERTLGLAPGTVTNIVKLTHGGEVASADAARIFPGYLDAAERLVKYVDQWKQP